MLAGAVARADTYYVSYFGTNQIEKFSSSGTDLGPFATTGLNGPEGLAFDKQGNLYVVNFLSGNIEKFSQTGVDLGPFISPAFIGFDNIIIDGSGNLYATSYISGNVEKFSSTGADLGVFASFQSRAYDLAFDSTGNLYVAEQPNNVEKFSPTGVDLGSFTTTNLSYPFGLAFDSGGNLCVANMGSNTIQKFSPTGAYLGALNVTGLSQPNGLFFDNGGNLYICDSNNNEIRKVSPSGVDLGVFAGTGTGSTPKYMVVQPANTSPSITAQPASTAVGVDVTASFTVGFTGIPTPTLQWQLSTDGGNTWSNLTDGTNYFGSATATLYVIDPATSFSGYQYRVIASNTQGSATSNAATLSVDVVPAITAQSGNQTLASGTSATFTVAATGNPSPSFQWQFSTNGGTTWANLTNGGSITGATSASLQISPITGSNNGQYRAVASNPASSIASTAATLVVLAPVPPPAGTLFVSYSNTNIIEEFSPAGTDLGAFAVTGLTAPQGIAVDSQGNLYAANSYSVEKFSPNGTDLGAFINTGSPGPLDLAFDSGGNLYTTCYSNGFVEKYSPSGVNLGSFANTQNNLWGLAFDKSGNLYTAYIEVNRVEKFSPTGADLGGFATNNINHPTGLAFNPSDNLYVSNQGTGTVQIYSPAGTYLGEVVATGLNEPTGLFFDSGGNLFICESNGNDIHKISPTGADLGIFATTGTGNPSHIAEQPPPSAAAILQQPGSTTVAVGATAAFTVAAGGFPAPTYQWQVSTDGGNTWTNLSDGSGVSGSATATLTLANTSTAMSGYQYRLVATNSQGSVTSSTVTLTVDVPPAVTTQPGNQTVNGGGSATFTVAASGSPTPTFQWQVSTNGGTSWSNLTNGGNISGATSASLQISPAVVSNAGLYRAVASNPAGSVNGNAAALVVLAPAPAPPGTFFVSNYATNTIEEFSTSGTDLGAFTATALNGPQGLAFDGKGNLYVVNSSSSSIEEFSPTGADLGTFAQTGLHSPVDIVFDSLGNLYATNNSSSNVEKFSPTGVDLGVFASTDTGPWGLVFNASGNLEVSNQQKSYVQKFSSTGASLGPFASTNIGRPTGLAISQSGNLCVADQTNGTVQIFSTTGTNLGAVAISPLNGPCGLLFDSGGNLFICDSNNNQIHKVSPAGIDLGVFAVTGSGHPVIIIAEPTPVAASITQQPVPLTVASGAMATFSVITSGFPSPTFQWQVSTDGGNTWTNLSDGNGVSGSVTATLSLTNAASGMSGYQYRVLATNSQGSATSSAATLTVDIPPSFTLQAGSQSANAGATVSFTMAVTGNPAPSIQWQVSTNGGTSWSNLTNGGTISGVTSATLQISSVALSNAGQYRAVASNSAGSVDSTAVSLIVLAAAPAPPGTFFVSYLSKNQIEEFSPSGTDLGIFAETGLNEPQGIAIDGQGNLYAVNNGSIEKYSAAGVDLGVFASGLNGPIDVVIDSSGNVYVSTYGGATVQKFSPTGVSLGVFAHVNASAWGLAFDNAGNLYVACNTANRVEKFSPTGVDLGSFASSNLSSPTGLAFDPSGNLYVANQGGSNTVQIFSPSGTYVGPVAVTGLSGPTGLFFDSGGNLYINDSGNNEIRKVSPTGVNLGIFAATGAGSSPSIMTDQPTPTAAAIITQPASLTASAGANATFTVITSGYPGPTFQWQVSTDGGNTWTNLVDSSSVSGSAAGALTLIGTTTTMTGYEYRVTATNNLGSATSNAATLMVDIPPAFAVQASNLTIKAGATATFTVVVAGNPAPSIQWQFSNNGGSTWSNLTNGGSFSGVTSVSLQISPLGGTNGGQYRAVATNPAATITSNTSTLMVLATTPTTPGTLFVSYNSKNIIEAFSPTGVDLGIFASSGLNSPQGLVFDGQGNLYAVNSGNIEKFSPLGADMGSLTRSGLSEPVQVVPDAAGNFYVSNFGSSVEKFSPTGADLGVFAATGSGPWGLAFDRAGNLYASEIDADIVEKFSPAGVDLGVFASSSLSRPTGLAFDLGGNLYVASQGYNAIKEYSPSGTYLGQVAVSGLHDPTGLFFDSGGNLYICDSANNQIHEVSAAGVDLGVFASTGSGSSPSTMVIQPGPSASTILLQPVPVTVAAGAVANFTVVPSGISTPTLQWQFSTDGGVTWTNLTDGAGISGSATATLSLADTATTQSGEQFRVIATNTLGSATSNPATLTVDVLPAITTQPTNAAVTTSTSATFTVAFTGSPTPSFQWQASTNGGTTWSNVTNGGSISGATSASLQLSTVTQANTGQYRVILTNPAGTVTSTAVSLTALAPAPAPAGTFFVSYYAKNSIEEFSPSGTDLGAFTATILNGPQGIAFDGEGSLYVLNSGNSTIEKFSPAGADLGTFAKTGLHSAVDIVFDNLGNLYASNNSSSSVEKFSPAGTDLGVFAHTANNPWGLAFDSGGNLCVSNQNSSDVQKFSPAGVSLGTFASTDLNKPTGLAFNQIGNLYVADQGSNTVQIFSPAGTNLGSVSVTGLNGPCGLFFDSGGNLFICDANNNQIHKASPAGADLGVFANTGSSSTPTFMIVQPGPSAASILVQPVPATVVAGATANFTIIANGIPAPALQWQLSTDGGNTWANLTDGGNISGSATANLSLANTTAAMLGNQYRAVATNALASVTSNPVALTVDFAPVFSSQPGVQTVIAGNATMFSVAASGNPAPVYHWQISLNGGLSWSNLTDGGNISGSGTATLSFSNTTLSMLGNEFRVIASNSAGSSTSNAATLTVDTGPVITSQPQSVTVIAGNVSTFSASATGSPIPSFVWQLSTDGGNTWSNLTPASGLPGTSSSFSFNNTTAAMLGDQIRVVVTNSVGSVTSNAITLTVNIAPAITTQPVSQTVVVGNATTFTAAANGNPPASIQWQISVNGGLTWSNLTDGGNVSGSATTTLSLSTTTTGMQGNLFRAVASNSIGSATSNVATLTVDIAPAITSQPGIETVIAGNATMFIVAASGNPPPSVQWQISINGGLAWSNLTDGGNISGSATASLSLSNTTAAMLGNLFRAVVTNSLGSVTSNAASLTVDTAPAITLDPSDQTVVAGNAIDFSAGASGNPSPTFQWQISTDGGSTWTNLTDGGGISGSGSAALSLSNTTADMLGSQFRAVATNTIGSATSDAATLTVNTAPALTSQPASQTIIAGNATTFTTSASGYPAASFQWQISTDGGLTWSNLTDGGNISGSATATLALSNTTAAMLGNQFRVIASNSVTSITTNAATLTVDFGPTFTTQPTDQTVVAGNTTAFIAAASGYPAPSFQWEISTDGGVTWTNLTDGGNVSGSATATLSLSNATANMLGDQFRTVVSNDFGFATSDSANLTVITVPVITSQPVSQTVVAGNATIFTAAATGYPAPSFQWQISTDGSSTWSNLTDGGNISGSAPATLSLSNITAAMLNNQFRALAGNAAGAAATSAAVLSVLYPPQITSQPVNAFVFSGNTATFTVTATGNPAPNFQWYFNKKLILSGGTSATLTITGVTSAKVGNYTVVASNGIGTSVTSSIATLALGVLPKITAQPANLTVTLSQNAIFSVAATGTPTPSIQWQLSTDNGVGWSNLIASANYTGVTSTNLTVNSTTASQSGFQFRVIASNLIGGAVSTATSKSVTLTINVPVTLTGLMGGNLSSLTGGNLGLVVGGNLTFTASATGSALKYQWQFNGKNIPGATSFTYTLSKAAATANGTFRVIVSNAVNSVTSDSFTVSILFPPMITTQPKALTVNPGSLVNFTVKVNAISTTPLTYQWQFNGVPLSNELNVTGSNTSSLLLNDVTSANAGPYQVVITNAAGSLSSASVKLTVK
jgi:sugar lactone lactonase YvrE